jgi:phosphate transport system protein
LDEDIPMSRLLDTGLEYLTTLLFRMGELAEETFSTSIQGFLKGEDVTERAASLSELLMGMTVDVEDKAFELMIKYQPVASDLRIIKSYIKIAYDFERIGRYSWDIAFIHKRLVDSKKSVYSLRLVGEMIDKVRFMIQTIVDSLKKHDAELAKTLSEVEDKVDKLYFDHLDLTPDTIPSLKSLFVNLLIVRYLERIADHTAYIAESIIYVATGEKLTIR